MSHEDDLEDVKLLANLKKMILTANKAAERKRYCRMTRI